MAIMLDHPWQSLYTVLCNSKGMICTFCQTELLTPVHLQKCYMCMQSLLETSYPCRGIRAVFNLPGSTGDLGGVPPACFGLSMEIPSSLPWLSAGLPPVGNSKDRLCRSTTVGVWNIPMLSPEGVGDATSSLGVVSRAVSYS